ncbi:MAG: hypothetical protein JNK09_20095 [Prolixibacteraceae bacterium]|nr:hypothetical protein [Prolixibacteraceae bacterium]
MFFDFLMPKIQRSYLLLVAALVWTFAGAMLVCRGFTLNQVLPVFWCVEVILSVLSGLVFFQLLFNRISKKHVQRIRSMPEEKPSVFAFFNLKSYLMMFSMIAMGITLRKTGIVPSEYLAIMYITMGIPLLMSSIRFYSTFLQITIKGKLVS